MKTILLYFAFVFCSTGFADNRSCLVQAIESATKSFQSKNLELDGPKITAEYMNRNIYWVNFEYKILRNSEIVAKKTRYMVFSDYSEEFNSLRSCKIKLASEMEN